MSKNSFVRLSATVDFNSCLKFDTHWTHKKIIKLTCADKTLVT